MIQNGALQNGMFQNGMLHNGTFQNGTLSKWYNIIMDWLGVNPNLA